VKPIVYVAHPVSGDVGANCTKVLKWLRLLTRMDPTRIYVAPWVGEVLAHLDLDPIPADFYDRVLSDDEDVVRRLDGICLTGVGHEAPNRRDNGLFKSTGMTREIAANALAGGVLINLSEYATAEECETEWQWQGIDGPTFIKDYIVQPQEVP
jgi:hypothetical protein